MADREISMLPALDAVTDETLVPVYQPGAQNPAQSMTGAQFRAFAEDTANQLLAGAQGELTALVHEAGTHASRASDHADSAKWDAIRAEDAAERAENAASGGGGSGSGVQPDWNQNDVSQPDYIRNRPFYTEGAGGEVVLEETTVTGSPSMYEGLYTGSFDPGGVTLEPGVTYVATYDGADYVCLCEADGIYGAYIGNPAMFSPSYPDTGEPFYLFVVTAGTSASLCANVGGMHTISVRLPGVKVKTLDEKYIPDTIARVEDIPEGFSGSWNNLADKPFTKSGEVILPETEITCTDMMGYYGWVLPIDQHILLVVGDKYIIRFNGADYERTVVESFRDDGYSTYGLGNFSLQNNYDAGNHWPDTGEPFFFDGDIVKTKEPGTYTVSISRVSREVIYESCIPDSIARKSEVTEVSEKIGDIDTALDAILAIQNSYIGGEGA